MKLIKPSYTIIEQQPGEIGMLKHIETCGRVAWKSEERVTDDSYIKFVEMLKGVNHGSVLEHGTIYLKVGQYDWNTICGNHYEDYFKNPYSIAVYHGDYYYITTNYRVLVENNWLDDLKYQCEPTEYHEKRVTVRMICDVGISREFNRHRTFSITEQSTRYCNFSKEKFGSELTFIRPFWLNEVFIEDYENDFSDEDESPFLSLLAHAEDAYFQLINKNYKPQQARNVLPLSLKTEVIYTGFISDWKHFFELRTASGAHPQAQELAIPLHNEFQKLNLL